MNIWRITCAFQLYVCLHEYVHKTDPITGAELFITLAQWWSNEYPSLN